MTCLEARKRIYDYLNNRISDQELKQFLDHVENCHECMEELRITYMVYSGVAKLDSDDDSSLNIDGTFKKNLLESRFYLFRIAARKTIRIMVDTAIFWAFLITLILQLRIWFWG
jgi:hypothetical protein